MNIFIKIIDMAVFDVYIHQKYHCKYHLMSVSLEHLGLQIKALRKQRGWSQSQLADMAGLDRTTLGMLERNDYSDIGIRKVQRVLELLGKKLTLANAGLPTLDELVAAQAEELQREG